MGQFNVPPGVSLSDPGGPEDPAAARYEEAGLALFDGLYEAIRAGFSVEDIFTVWAGAAEEAHYDDEEEAVAEAESERQLAEIEDRAHLQFDPDDPQSRAGEIETR